MRFEHFGRRNGQFCNMDLISGLDGTMDFRATVPVREPQDLANILCG